VNLTKAEIRELVIAPGCDVGRAGIGLPVFAHSAYSEVTGEKLRTIERAERVLRGFGFRVCRVRHHVTIWRA
jgi:PP-loop superfamily ATP-utilizing enzyme